MRRVVNWFLNCFPGRRRRLERELELELRFHAERRVEDLVDSGLSEAGARKRAAFELDGFTPIREDVRAAWVPRWIDRCRLDLRYAIRTLWRSRSFTATAVLLLGIGIGATAGVFSLFDQVLIRRLPGVTHPERLVHLDWAGNSLSSSWGSGHLMSYLLCRELEDVEGLFDGVFCRHPTAVNVRAGERSTSVRAEIVSGSYFPTLGVHPSLGRLIGPSDDLRPGAHAVVVISYRFWADHLGADPDVVGHTVAINHHPMTVIGVSPADFEGVDLGAPTAVWIPAMMKKQATPEWDGLLDRRTAWMHVFARVEPGLTVAQARPRLQAWFKGLLDRETRSEDFPRVTEEQRRSFLASTIDVLPAAQGSPQLRSFLQRPLWMLLGTTFLLLLLASLNVAGLLIARGATRGQELDTRVALGASQGRVAGQLLVENALIALGGGLLGLLMAPLVTRVLLSMLAEDSTLSAALDARVVLFAFLVSLVAAGLFGVAPAVRLKRQSLTASLGQRSRILTGIGFRRALVTGQIALTLVLLVGAGLFVQTLTRMHGNVGFDSGNLVMVSVDPLSIGRSDSEAERTMRDLMRTLEDLPGVTSASVANTRMLQGGSSATTLTVLSDVGRAVTDGPVSYTRVGPGFFTTLGVRFAVGRDFDERDVRGSGGEQPSYRSIIVNESFAHRYFGRQSPIGRLVGFGSQPNTPTQTRIVGLVSDFSRRSLRDAELPQAFVPFWDGDSRNGTFYLRARGELGSTFASIQTSVGQLDPALPIAITTYDEQIGESMRTEELLASLSIGFGVLALLVSVVGLFGLMSFVVTLRTREIGVRLALGATRRDAIALVVREALIMIGIGALIALPMIWALGRLVEAQLFGVGAIDPATVAAASVLLAIVGLGAAGVPARRASSISPADALRFE